MLTDLLVEGLGVIDRADVSFDNGCVALTGETGAGKTLVVAAIGLLLGDRADRSLLRRGVEEAVIEARFEVDPGHAAVVAAREGIDEPIQGEIVLTRRIRADGKSRARINGRMVPASLLKEVGASLVEIAGQNQHQRLSSRSAQREMLDSFAGERVPALAHSVAVAVGRAAEAASALEGFSSSAADRERRRDALRFEIDEIEAAGVQEGELARLEQEIARADNAARIGGAIENALDAVGSDDGAAARAVRAAAELEPVVGVAPEIGPVLESLRSAALELEEVGASLARLAGPTEMPPLDELRARLEVVRRIERKYGGGPGGARAYLEAARSELDDLEDDGPALEKLASEASEARRRAVDLAEELSALRKDAAPRLEAAVDAVLDRLAMAGARVEIALEPCDLSIGGVETVELLLAANTGEAPKPLARVASGGELARLALALHLLTSTGAAPTMIFDEVDAGVGGAAARAVGSALADLARKRAKQVVVVTHLPQVAAFADLHLRVTKQEEAGRTTARIVRVEGDERVEELSRMLAGFPDSETARGHARELLELGAKTG